MIKKQKMWKEERKIVNNKTCLSGQVSYTRWHWRLPLITEAGKNTRAYHLTMAANKDSEADSNLYVFLGVWTDWRWSFDLFHFVGVSIELVYFFQL